MADSEVGTVFRSPDGEGILTVEDRNWTRSYALYDAVDDEQVDVAPPVGLATDDATEDDDTDEVVERVSVECAPNALDERQNRAVELVLLDTQYRVVFL